jgi:hypothetical protein
MNYELPSHQNLSVGEEHRGYTVIGVGPAFLPFLKSGKDRSTPHQLRSNDRQPGFRAA